jgi:chromosome segregation ATPase
MEADPGDARIRELEAEIAQFGATTEELLKRIRQLEERSDELERTAHRQAAPLRRPDKKRKPPEQHRSIGRPNGHRPSWRRRPEHVVDKITVPLRH